MGDGQIRRVNQELLEKVNRQISFKARRFSHMFLTGAFRSLFRIQKSQEFDTPSVFQLEDDPETLLLSRIDTWQLQQFSLALAQDTILARQYQQLSEYELVLMLDVSRSMMLNWWAAYGAPLHLVPQLQSPDHHHLYWTKLFNLKYLAASFLNAARENGFRATVVFFGGLTPYPRFSSREDNSLSQSILHHLDKAFQKLVASKHVAPTEPAILGALREQMEIPSRRLILCISDFMDGVRHLDEAEPRLELGSLMGPLYHVASSHQLLVVKINDDREVKSSGFRTVGHSADTAYFNQEARPQCRPSVAFQQIQDYINLNQAWHENLERALQSHGLFGGTATGTDVEDILTRLFQVATH